MPVKHKIGTYRRCLYFNDCHAEEIHDGEKWKEHWYHYKDGYICNNHHNKLVTNKKRTPEYMKKYNEKWQKINNRRWLKFKTRRYLLKDDKLRTGQCQHCNKKIGDEYIDFFGEVKIIVRTAFHHIQYHEDDPFRDIIELCTSCHNRETWRLKRDKSELSNNDNSS